MPPPIALGPVPGFTPTGGGIDALAGVPPGRFPRRAFRSIFGLFIRSYESNPAVRKQPPPATPLPEKCRRKVGSAARFCPTGAESLSLTAENSSETQWADPSQR